MAQLDAGLQAEIDKIKAESGLYFSKGEISAAINRLEAAWEVLPGSKILYDESFHLANYILQMALQNKDFSKAAHWANVLQKCDPERPEIGEREFIAGMTAFESGDFAAAKKWFVVANEKSNGLCFQGEDKKYRQLLKKSGI